MHPWLCGTKRRLDIERVRALCFTGTEGRLHRHHELCCAMRFLRAAQVHTATVDHTKWLASRRNAHLHVCIRIGIVTMRHNIFPRLFHVQKFDALWIVHVHARCLNGTEDTERRRRNTLCLTRTDKQSHGACRVGAAHRRAVHQLRRLQGIAADRRDSGSRRINRYSGSAISSRTTTAPSRHTRWHATLNQCILRLLHVAFVHIRTHTQHAGCRTAGLAHCRKRRTIVACRTHEAHIMLADDTLERMGKGSLVFHTKGSVFTIRHIRHIAARIDQRLRSAEERLSLLHASETRITDAQAYNLSTGRHTIRSGILGLGTYNTSDMRAVCARQCHDRKYVTIPHNID